jgi:hypothetical protein
MKRNHDDDLPRQSRDAEFDHKSEQAVDSPRASAETGADRQLAPEQTNLREPDEHRLTASQEFDEQRHYAEPQFAERESWLRSDERDDAELSTHFGARVTPKKNKRNRRLIAAVALLVITIGSVFALFYTFSPSRSVKVSLKTKQPKQAQDATAKPDKAPDDLTAEAIAEVRSAISTPSAGAAAAAVTGAAIPRASDNLSAPAASAVLPPDTIAADKPSDTTQREASSREVSRRNKERSIRFAIDDQQATSHKVSLKLPPTDSASGQKGDMPVEASKLTSAKLARVEDVRNGTNGIAKVLTKQSIKPVIVPSFGSILPVRTLGKIYTLRSGSSIRLELTRYVSGEGWSLPKGTVLIGQVRGSEQDRAFIAVTGFIDPSRDRFVKLTGETLGDDGGSGIRGKFHKLSSGWSRAFARVGSAAVSVAGAIAGSRISGQPVIVTDVGSRTISPFSSEVDSTLLQQARGFVEVPAGAAGFVMITKLPADAEGVDAEPDHLAQAPDTIATNANEAGTLTQEELSDLLTTGDTTRIREALPRLSPQMRRIAEIVLAESSQKQLERE